MDSDSDKENYFSLYMKKKKNNEQKKDNFCSNKRFKNKSISSQKLNDDTKLKSALKLILESPDKKRKNKNAFSFVKSYLLNLHDSKNKNFHSTKNKNNTIEKRKTNNEKFNPNNLNDIKIYAISSPQNYQEKNYDNNRLDNNQKIEQLKNRIFNLMNIIDNFENNYIKSKKPLQIKEQFDKIKYKISPISSNVHIEKKPSKTCKNSDFDKIKKINYFKINDDINDNFAKTERMINIPEIKKLKNKNNKNIYAKLYEDFNNINNLESNNKNLTLTKRYNGRQHSAVNSGNTSDKNIAFVLLNRQKNKNNNKINKGTNMNNSSTFLKLISSNIISKNELKKINSNFANNKSKSMINKMKSNSSSNKTLYKNDKNENMDEKDKKKNIFKRRINYSNFINQKMKQNNIIERNKGTYLKQNMISKPKLSNKSNGCNTCFDINHNDNYVKNLLNKNNKSKSIDKNNLNII